MLLAGSSTVFGEFKKQKSYRTQNKYAIMYVDIGFWVFEVEVERHAGGWGVNKNNPIAGLLLLLLLLLRVVSHMFRNWKQKERKQINK